MHPTLLRHRRAAQWIAVLLLWTAYACAPPQSPDASPPEDGQRGQAYSGLLAKTVESGGWLLRSGEKTYLLLEIDRYQQEEWFREGSRVNLRGEVDEEVMTFHMQGTPLRVHSMSPAQ